MLKPTSGSTSRWPHGHQFALAIVDDTDFASLANIGPVYRLLDKLQLRFTKSVWPLASDSSGHIGGSDLTDRAYAHFVRWLHASGFEICLHGVKNHHATRSEVLNGLAVFEETIGTVPQTHCNHSRNRDNIYWGRKRLSSPVLQAAYAAAEIFRGLGSFEGDQEGSPYFWGDICRDRIAYVRNFVFPHLDLSHLNPTLPYSDPDKPYVRFWFSSSDGSDVARFNRLISEENQDRLEADGGLAIIYTHFARGFVQSGCLNARFEQLITRLAAKNGWFVPVATLLDFLRNGRTTIPIAPTELRNMERAWFRSRLARRSRL